MLLLQRPGKRPVQQRLKQVLGLADGLALLGAQAFVPVDDLAEFLLAWK